MNLMQKIAAGESLTAQDIANMQSIEVSNANLRVALVKLSLYAQINTAVNNSTDEELKVLWDYSSTIFNYHPSVCKMAVALGMTEEQMLQIFSLASTL